MYRPDRTSAEAAPSADAATSASRAGGHAETEALLGKGSKKGRRRSDGTQTLRWRTRGARRNPTLYIMHSEVLKALRMYLFVEQK